uniref:Ovule protein n=1 Tax=Haemonchus placei TaxID=6290 RepID=A0A0N4WSF8_HAEPC
MVILHAFELSFRTYFRSFSGALNTKPSFITAAPRSVYHNMNFRNSVCSSTLLFFYSCICLTISLLSYL